MAIALSFASQLCFFRQEAADRIGYVSKREYIEKILVTSGGDREEAERRWHDHADLWIVNGDCRARVIFTANGDVWEMQPKWRPREVVAIDSQT